VYFHLILNHFCHKTIISCENLTAAGKSSIEGWFKTMLGTLPQTHSQGHALLPQHTCMSWPLTWVYLSLSAGHAHGEDSLRSPSPLKGLGQLTGNSDRSGEQSQGKQPSFRDKSLANANGLRQGKRKRDKNGVRRMEHEPKWHPQELPADVRFNNSFTRTHTHAHVLPYMYLCIYIPV